MVSLQCYPEDNVFRLNLILGYIVEDTTMRFIYFIKRANTHIWDMSHLRGLNDSKPLSLYSIQIIPREQTIKLLVTRGGFYTEVTIGVAGGRSKIIIIK